MRWRGRLFSTLVGAAAAAMLLGGAACSGSAQRGATGAAAEVPSRAATAGEALLPLLPEGAQVVLELDLDRARRNPVLGALVHKLVDVRAEASPPATKEQGASPLGALASTPLSSAHAVVVASYRVGAAEAASLTLVRTSGDLAGQARELGAVAISRDVLALGPAELIEQARARAAAAAEDAANPRAELALLALRARPMPAAAEGAILRVTAELSFEARLALAKQTNLDPPPARLALWMDAVDDAALILLADSSDVETAASRPSRETRDAERSSARLGAALQGALGELAKDPRVAALGLGPSLRAAQLERAGSWVKVAVLVGPQRLQRAVQRAELWLGARDAVSPNIPPATAAPATAPPPSASPSSSGPGAPAGAVSSPGTSTVPSKPEPP